MKKPESKMVRHGLLIPRKGQLGGPSQVVVTMALLLLLLPMALPVEALSGCEKFSCKEICDINLNHRPQDCDSCCNGKVNGPNGKEDTDERFKALEGAIQELRVMVGVILAVVVVLLLAVVGLIFRHTSTRALKVALPVFFKSRDEERASIEKRPPPPSKVSKVPAENRNSTVVRIADYQNNHSPLTKRMRPSGQVVHENSGAPPTFTLPAETPRTRQPSESTCPEDTDPPHPHQHAYDNLALSTSTLHDTTTSSTSTLGPAVSTNTLNTTLPSVNPTTPVMR